MAVMNGSCRGSGCRLQGVVLLFVICLTSAALASPRSCELVRKEVELKGFFGQNVLDRPDNGLICGEGSCCSADLERNMSHVTRSDLEKYMKDTLSKVASIIEVRARKFDEKFRDMMIKSKHDFHDMFERTYGKIYLQNAEVFSDFFNELETYYKKGTVRLSDTIETFFGILYQRMFIVINSQYVFDDKYLECVNEHMVDMRPFGEVPHKLNQQLRRSFVATRTLYKSLTRAAEAVREVLELRLDDECGRQMTKMQMCGTCKGEAGPRACSGYCVDTVSLCLRKQMQLSESWDGFVDAIDKVAERLMGPYNIEDVVDPLDIKISEAVMIFQENGPEISKKIHTKCGMPVLNRQRRKAGYEDAPEDNPNTEIRYEPMKMGNNKKKHKKGHEKVVESGPTLEKFIMDIKTKIKDMKHFWQQLPYQHCNTIAASPSQEGECWNGTAMGSYNQTKPVLGPTEVTLITEQTYVLNGLTMKLRKAHQGEEVEIVDDTEESFDGSGSGSGDGDDDDENAEQNGNVEEKDITFQVNRINEEVYPVPAAPSTTFQPEVVRTSSGSDSRQTNMSLARALVQYLLPMVMVWFGGAIKDLL